MLYNINMKVLPISDNIDYYLENPNLIKITRLHPNANSFKIGQKINKLTILQPMQYIDLATRYEGIVWVCRCDCGMYYLLKGTRLKLNPPKSCPACDEHKIIESSGNIHYSGKGEEYYIEKYIKVFYKYYEPYMELEDFKQELWYWFLYCETKFGNKFYHLGHYLTTTLNRLKRAYMHEELNKTNEMLEQNKVYSLDFIIDKLDNEYLINTILELLDKLKPNQAYIIKERFGLKNNKIKTLNEIGVELGLTRERVRQIEAAALKKLKTLITDFYE